MKIAVWPADEMGCGHYRLRFPAKALADQGADVRIDPVGPVIEWSKSWAGLAVPPADCHAVRAFPYDADVVVLQRPARQHWTEIIALMKEQGIKVVVDVDDMFDAIPHGNVARHAYQDIAVNHRWVESACKLADAVTCSTPALLRRYGFGHGVVLSNLVPESYLSIFGLKRPETIGWPGFVGTHPGDLEVTDGSVAQVLSGTDWTFHNIGDGVGVAEGLGLADGFTYSRFGMRISTDASCGGKFTFTGKVEFAEYADAIAELEIGIVPLEESKFNEAKSALKASEMAAVGVPVVMSPTPDNLRLNRLGVGLVAESRGQWQRIIRRLMNDPDLRYELSEKGREVMATQTYELHADRWMEAWGAKVSVAA